MAVSTKNCAWAQGSELLGNGVASPHTQRTPKQLESLALTLFGRRRNYTSRLMTAIINPHGKEPNYFSSADDSPGTARREGTRTCGPFYAHLRPTGGMEDIRTSAILD